MKGKGVGRVVMIRAVERDDPGSTPASGGRFLSTESTCVLTLDGVPLTPMSSHCWHVKEPYHSVRVQVMGYAKPREKAVRVRLSRLPV